MEAAAVVGRGYRGGEKRSGIDIYNNLYIKKKNVLYIAAAVIAVVAGPSDPFNYSINYCLANSYTLK